jgi:RHS repeat-associated protein
MAGISNKALNGPIENKYQYNSKEEQRKEFNDGSGLDWYDYGARMYDAQIGRWNHIDPLAGLSKNNSPFVYVSNNPVNYIDPDGKKEKPFNRKKDKGVSFLPYTETPLWIYDNFGKEIGLAPECRNAYNCHSFAFHNMQGDPTDPRNAYLVNMGVLKWDESPSDDIKSGGYKQLGVDEANVEGDRVIYYEDSNGNKQYDEGENIVHSAVVGQVDKEGNTTLVVGKMGQMGVSVNHPNADGYYQKGERMLTSRAYFRAPTKNKTVEKKSEGEGSSTKNNSSNQGLPTWSEFGNIVSGWLQVNSNITITIK